MKKLELTQMENLTGGGPGRQCFMMGIGIAFLAAAAGAGGAIGAVFAGGSIGGYFQAASSGCF